MDIDEDTALKLAHDAIYTGGFTYPSPPKKGYMVGGGGTVNKIIWPTFTKDIMGDAETIKLRLSREIITTAAKMCGRDNYLGGWYDAVAGIMYIEEASHFLTLDMAIRTAQKNKQKAIYSCKDQIDVDISGR